MNGQVLIDSDTEIHMVPDGVENVWHPIENRMVSIPKFKNIVRQKENDPLHASHKRVGQAMAKLRESLNTELPDGGLYSVDLVGDYLIWNSPPIDEQENQTRIGIYEQGATK